MAIADDQYLWSERSTQCFLNRPCRTSVRKRGDEKRTWAGRPPLTESRSVFGSEGKREIEEEARKQNREQISELQVELDRPNTLLQDKRQELQRKLESAMKLEDDDPVDGREESGQNESVAEKQLCREDAVMAQQ
ncbi:hypothetical protein E3U43_017904 [Larimichthys crocea]|uniref:Uncharacterized protein n=1 Tax=Larimichthys crocea TaxID=215358 RepID=A0ACD3R298_LARCR|nr:hypothetical protein E3U43_017904 [Larimichthys crocea]